MSWTWRDDAGDELATLALTETPATAWLWWSYGVAGAGPVDPCYLPFEVEDPDNPGTYLLSGHPALDGQELQVEVIDSDNPGSDPDFAPILVGPTRLGTGATLRLTGYRGDCALQFRLALLPVLGSGGADELFGYRLLPRSGSAPVTFLPSMLGDGIDTGAGDHSLSEWLEHVEVVETGTPDDYVQVPARDAKLDGVTRYWAAEAVQLDQVDGDSATLASGEEYKALLTQNDLSITVTKGSKAAAGAALWPAKPSGELLVSQVRVPYGATGSVITNAEITNPSVAGRFHVRAGTGLTAIVGAGRQWVGGVFYGLDVERTVSLDPSASTYLWLDAACDILDSTTAVKPTPLSLPLALVVTDGSGVTAVTDLRSIYWEPRAQLIVLGQSGTASAASDVDRTVVQFAGCLDRGRARVCTASSGGATGTTDVELVRTRAGTPTTIATASIAAGEFSALLVFTDTLLEPGDYLSLNVAASTSGGTQETHVSVAVVAHPAAA